MAEIGDCSLTNFHRSTRTLPSPHSGLGQRLITSRLRSIEGLSSRISDTGETFLCQPISETGFTIRESKGKGKVGELSTVLVDKQGKLRLLKAQ